MPFKIAFGISEGEDFLLDDVEKNAYLIVAGQMDGNEFDWNVMNWRAPD